VQDVKLRQPGWGVRGEALLHGLRDLFRRLRGPRPLLPPDAIQLLEDAAETDARAALPVAGGKVGAGEERLALRREEDAHRPAAVLGEHLDGLHVDGVHVGALLAIDLHRHEALVQDPRDVGASNDSSSITWHQWQVA